MADEAKQPDAAVIEEDIIVEDQIIEDQIVDELWVKDSSGPSLLARLGAEVAGAFLLVAMGVGTALFVGLGNNGSLTAGLAFGAAVVIGIIAFGHISGAHFNPAVTIGVWIAGRFPGRDVAPFILAQLVGATLAGGALYVITAANPQVEDPQSIMATGANMFGDLTAGGWGVGAAIIVEIIATGILVLAVLAATAVRAAKATAPFIIGIALAFVLVWAIPITNGSVNPARSTGIALFAGPEALTQLWVFWLAPIVGAIIVGLLFRAFGSQDDIEVVEVFED
ncbi:aquaporin [Demequina aurantiaca]|uniref:aquaporin n=1 Tax=Demequina aurantiaca TaxID=676200 RepID=UPI003D348E45